MRGDPCSEVAAMVIAERSVGLERAPRAASPPLGAAVRIAELDALRGLAALSVVACHYLLLLSATPFGRAIMAWLAVPPLSLLRTARGSVILFFVLSGYVLAPSLIGERRPSWLGFALRRLCRIWLPFAATILASFALGCLLMPPDPMLPSVWSVNAWPHETLSVEALVPQISMTTMWLYLDVPAWSLVIELRISLVFPLLLFLLRRAPATVLAATLVLAVAGRAGPPWLAAFLPVAASYVVYFAAGAWLALNRARVAGLVTSASGPVQFVFAVVALLLVSIPGDSAGAAAGTGLGAVLIIALTAAPASKRLLAARWCRFLGQISYSLYLTHVVVLMTLGLLLGNMLSVPLLLAVATPVIGLVAWVGYRWIERPSIRLGRALSAVADRRAPHLACIPAELDGAASAARR